MGGGKLGELWVWRGESLKAAGSQDLMQMEIRAQDGAEGVGGAHRAVASWELVVISMASCTLFCSASRVRWSTGSTDCMSTLLMTRPFWLKRRLGRTASLSSKPKTAVQMIRFEFWKGGR